MIDETEYIILFIHPMAWTVPNYHTFIAYNLLLIHIRYRLLCKPNMIENRYLYYVLLFDTLAKFNGTVHAIGCMNNIFSFINHAMQNCNYGFFLY